MVIDIIQDRMEYGEYTPGTFYRKIEVYPQADKICLAMDEGEEEDVKRELVRYIVEHDYNLDIVKYIIDNSWI